MAMLSVIQPTVSTPLFIGLLVVAALASVRRRQADKGLSPAVTQELKGIAVLMVVFSHIGYFLVATPHFLSPLTILAGVGVNIFLFLSGYGLTLSQSARPLATVDWWRKRLPKLYLPMIISVLLVIILDAIFNGRTYDIGYIARSLLGWYPQADIYNDLNSPLWYFSFIIINYLLFPLLFWRRRAWLSAIAYFIAGLVLVDICRRLNFGITGLYRVHIAAFPLGVLAAWIMQQPARQVLVKKLTGFQRRPRAVMAASLFVQILLVAVIVYFAIHSGVGSGPIQEQFISLLTVIAFVLLFALKSFQLKLFGIIGVLSYELYLLHWPLLSRHDFLYSWLPGWLATAAWLIFLLGLSKLLQLLVAALSERATFGALKQFVTKPE